MTDKTQAAPEAQTQTGEAVQGEAGQAQVTLGPQDLNAYANIIKVAAERGVFKAEELSQVGAAYDKLTAFLKSIAPPAEAEVNPDESTDTPAPAAEGTNADAAQ